MYDRRTFLRPAGAALELPATGPSVNTAGAGVALGAAAFAVKSSLNGAASAVVVVWQFRAEQRGGYDENRGIIGDRRRQPRGCGPWTLARSPSM